MMTRYTRLPRNAEELDAIELCLKNILEVHRQQPGYIHVWQRKEDGTNQFVNERSENFKEAFVAKQWEFENGQIVDLYCRQQTYHEKWWQAGSVKHTPVKSLHSLTVDLDCYNKGLSPSQAVDGALNELRLEGIPPPNHVDYSGNGTAGGAYLRWLLEPRDAEGGLERSRDTKLWKSCIAKLVEALDIFGADPNATDLARWLRVPGSVNSKYSQDGNGAPSFREHVHGNLVDLEELAFPLGERRLSGDLPAREHTPELSDGQLHQPVQKSTSPNSVHPHVHIRQALSGLNKLRCGMKEGKRNEALYRFVVLHLGSGLSHESIKDKATEFASNFDPPLPEPEMERTISSGLKARKMPHSYRSLISSFGITPKEQTALGIRPIPPVHDSHGQVIEANKPYHRTASQKRTMEHRRRNGVRPRVDVNAEKSKAQSAGKRAKFKTIHDQMDDKSKRNISAIARATDLHPQTVRKYQKEDDP